MTADLQDELLGRIPRRPGSYLLQLICAGSTEIPVGRAGILRLRPGCYLYVGSAFGPGGLAARLRHHLAPGGARPHWHLDYLRPHLAPARLWFTTDPGCWEHRWAATLAALPGATLPGGGLGASDCRCPSHLFHRPRLLTRGTFRRHLLLRGPAPRLRELTGLEPFQRPPE